VLFFRVVQAISHLTDILSKSLGLAELTNCVNSSAHASIRFVLKALSGLCSQVDHRLLALCLAGHRRFSSLLMFLHRIVSEVKDKVCCFVRVCSFVLRPSDGVRLCLFLFCFYRRSKQIFPPCW
jgi:hypothetical protein